MAIFLPNILDRLNISNSKIYNVVSRTILVISGLVLIRYSG